MFYNIYWVSIVEILNLRSIYRWFFYGAIVLLFFPGGRVGFTTSKS